MPQFIIKTDEGNELTVEAEQVKIDILNHQYTSLLNKQVISLDEPIGLLTIVGKRKMDNSKS